LSPSPAQLRGAFGTDAIDPHANTPLQLGSGFSWFLCLCGEEKRRKQMGITRTLTIITIACR
jgi:hypothetical protein